MNRNDFLNLMADNNPLNRQTIGEIYELIDIFPYFQSAHLLLLKGLQSSADIKFENQLRNSAIHIADREVLYYFLRKKTSVATPPEIVIKPESTIITTPSETEQTVIESGKNSIDLIEEIEKNSDEESRKKEHDITEAFSGHSVLIASEADNEEPAGVIMLDEEPAPDDTRVFFMDPGFSVPESSDLLELDLGQPQSDDLQENKVGQVPSQDAEINPKKLLQSDLIDKFIISNPRIEPNREKTEVPVEDISKPFVEEGGGFVTETLARIYVSQGYYSKAIDIFEKLSLKFPEKSSYFASQIEKVKENIKK
jgi:hypothetical protein